MKKYFVYALYLLVLFLLQTAALQVWSVAVPFVPQLVLLLAIVFALAYSLPETLWFSFFAGFLLELFSAQFFGAQILAIVLTALTVYFITRRLTTQEISFLGASLLVVLSTLLLGLWIFLYDGLISFLGVTEPLSWRSLLSSKIFWTILANLLFFYPVRAIFKLLPK